MDFVEKSHPKHSVTDNSLSSLIRAAGDLLRIDKQYGTLLVLLPALWALFLASGGQPDMVLMLIIIMGAFLMRSAGCAINDIADRKLDPLVDRTKTRPLAAGKIEFSKALIVFLTVVLAAALLTLYMNPLAVILSVGCLFFVILYPFMKRVVSIPQVFLGIAFGYGSIIVWAAVREKVELTAILIFLSTVTWAVAYDTIYAMMDIDDDRRIGVKSTAILFGKYVKKVVALFFGLTLLLLILIGTNEGMGPFYFAAVALSAACFFRQVCQTAAGMSREAAFGAFKSNVAVGFIILGGILSNSFF